MTFLQQNPNVSKVHRKGRVLLQNNIEIATPIPKSYLSLCSLQLLGEEKQEMMVKYCLNPVANLEMVEGNEMIEMETESQSGNLTALEKKDDQEIANEKGGKKRENLEKRKKRIEARKSYPQNKSKKSYRKPSYHLLMRVMRIG